MAKEITLSDLAASTKPTQKSINDEPVKEEVTTSSDQTSASHNNMGPKLGSGNLKKDVKFNPSQVANSLISVGKMKPKEDDTEDDPIVDTAFTSMVDTINRKKDGVKELLNTMENNAQEDALDQELDGKVAPTDNNIINESVSNNTNTSSNQISDYNTSSLDDELEKELASEVNNIKSESKEVSSNNNTNQNINQYNFDNETTNKEETDDRFKERISTTREDKIPATPITEQDKENEDLDNLLRDLDNNNEVIDDEAETSEEVLAKIKKSFQNIKINQDQIDFTKFTIEQKPINSSFILNNLQNNKFKKADWALYYTKRSLTFSECDGPELDALRRSMDGSNDVNRVIASLQFVYNHVIDANKPSFESWCKLIRTEDVDSMYYGIYKACYSDSNLIARTCTAPACGKTSLIETDINQMVRYGRENDDHEKIKTEFDEILRGDTTTEKDVFKSTLMQISNDLVVAYSPATLYSTFIMYATLRNDITTRYSDTLSTMSYIDNFFYIDRENNKLVPIEIKEYPGNLNKTVLNKLKVYRQILKSLTADQFNVFMGKLNNLIEMPKIYYMMPECKCPECDATMPETQVESMLSLLFTRAQLARIRSL